SVAGLEVEHELTVARLLELELSRHVSLSFCACTMNSASLYHVSRRAGPILNPSRSQFKGRKDSKHCFFRGRCQDALHGNILGLGILRAPNTFRGLGKIVQCPAQL